jgi:hypothetical protein
VQYDVGESTYDWKVRFTNVNTNQVYEFDVPYGSGSLPAIPKATYNVYFFSPDLPPYSYQFELCSNWEYGTQWTFYGYYLDENCAYISIY